MWTSHLSALDFVVGISLKFIRMKESEDIEEKWKIIIVNEWKLLEIVVNEVKWKKIPIKGNEWKWMEMRFV